MNNNLLRNGTRTTTQTTNGVLIIQRIGKNSFFFSQKHEFVDQDKSYLVNYTTSFYIDDLFVKEIMQEGQFNAALSLLEKFVSEQAKFCACIDLQQQQLLQIITYFFNSLSK
jgi:hypothetical protein